MVCWKEIHPGTFTFSSPAATTSATTSNKASRQAPASLLETPARPAIAAIKSLLFIDILLVGLLWLAFGHLKNQARFRAKSHATRFSRPCQAFPALGGQFCL